MEVFFHKKAMAQWRRPSMTSHDLSIDELDSKEKMLEKLYHCYNWDKRQNHFDAMTKEERKHMEE